MPSNNPRPQNGVMKNKRHICLQCGFHNNLSVDYCEICFNSLDPIKPDTVKPYNPQPKKEKSPGININLPVRKPLSWRQELKQPSVISGLIVLAMAISLWLNYFLSRRPLFVITSSAGDSLALYNSISQVREVPGGLFSYGGALYFASLIANGMNDAVFQEHPNFNLRYTKPQDSNQSYTKGIQMLLDGELSFAFNGRPLIDREYSKANLRNIKLQQIPIAIDAIVFFSNKKVAVNGLSLDQVRKIFDGTITNWLELGGENLPINPVLLSPEDVEVLGLNSTSFIPKRTQYVANHTLALRKVLATPGAISFASSSLVQDQQLVKILDLAADNSNIFFSPFIAGKPNLAIYKNGEYPLTRRLFLVIRQDGTPDYLAGKAYAQMLLSKQGQAIVEASGLVPLHNK